MRSVCSAFPSSGPTPPTRPAAAAIPRPGTSAAPAAIAAPCKNRRRDPPDAMARPPGFSRAKPDIVHRVIPGRHHPKINSAPAAHNAAWGLAGALPAPPAPSPPTHPKLQAAGCKLPALSVYRYRTRLSGVSGALATTVTPLSSTW